MATNKYEFYFSKDNESNYISIEKEFNGLLYMKCSGLEEVGKPKNKYTENYADSDTLRVYEPDFITHEPTDVVFTLLFIGEDRKSTYDSFYNYVKHGKFYYYDTARFKKAYLTLLEAVKPSEDEYKGGTPYMQADFKFKNMWGKCTAVSKQENK